MRGLTTTHRLAIVVLAGIIVLASLVGRAWYVHDNTWEWSLTIAEAPTKIQFADRTYLRGATDMKVPEAAVAVGRTLGGGQIWSDHWPAEHVPAVIWVRDGMRATTYALSGGP